MSTQDILSQLPEIEWQGLTAPCELAPYDITHRQPRREWPYVDGAGHDWTGREPLKLNARLYFLNTMLGSTSNFHYPGNWLRWRDALLIGETGKLVHPDLGEMDARVMSAHVDLTARVRSGIIVDVVWEDTVVDPAVLSFFGEPDIDPAVAAAAADAAVKAVLGKYPDGVGEGPDLFESWDQLKGQVGSAAMAVEGAVNQMQAQVGGVIADFEALNDVDLNPAITTCKALWDSLEAYKAKVVEKTVSRPIKFRQVTAPATFNSLAGETGNTVGELMGLNPALVAKPKIPAGSVVQFYGGSQFNSPLPV